MVQFAFGSRFCVHFEVCLHPPTKMRSSPTLSSQVFESPVKEDSPLSVSLRIVPLASVSLFKFCVLCVLCRIRDELSYRHNPNISVMFSNSYSVSYKYTGNLGERINAFAFNLGLYFLSLFLSQKKQKEKRKKPQHLHIQYSFVYWNVPDPTQSESCLCIQLMCGYAFIYMHAYQQDLQRM